MSKKKRWVPPNGIPITLYALRTAGKALKHAVSDMDDEWSTPNRLALRERALAAAQRQYDKARAAWVASGSPERAPKAGSP